MKTQGVREAKVVIGKITVCFALAMVVLFSCEAVAELPYLQKSLDQKFSRIDGAVLAVNPTTGEVLASIHPDVFFVQKQPPGSLIKIFTLYAYISRYGSALPKFHCPPTLAKDPDGCWDRNGHGEVDAIKAVGYSCNVYFRQLAAKLEPVDFAAALKTFQLIRDESEILSLPQDSQRKQMVGNTTDWSVSPALLLRAYCSLYNGGVLWAPDSRRLTFPAALMETVRKGMRMGGEEGTSLLARKESGVPILGKTGTSLLLVGGKPDIAKTQGWWIGFYPQDHPKIAIMTFLRNGRGAVDAAPLGGKVLFAYLSKK